MILPVASSPTPTLPAAFGASPSKPWTAPGYALGAAYGAWKAETSALAHADTYMRNAQVSPLEAAFGAHQAWQSFGHVVLWGSVEAAREHLFGRFAESPVAVLYGNTTHSDQLQIPGDVYGNFTPHPLDLSLDSDVEAFGQIHGGIRRVTPRTLGMVAMFPPGMQKKGGQYGELAAPLGPSEIVNMLQIIATLSGPEAMAAAQVVKIAAWYGVEKAMELFLEKRSQGRFQSPVFAHVQIRSGDVR